MGNGGGGGAWIVLASVLSALSAWGGDFQFKKTVLSAKYDSEGACAGDMDGDGKPDLISGPYWYKGPAFAERHEYQAVKDLDPAGSVYTDNFMCWTDDFNGDGHADILMAGLPGNPGYWYQNPGPGTVSRTVSAWVRRVAVAELGNESPELLDINGDGKRELAYNTSDGYMGWAVPDKANAAGPWIFYRVTSKGPQYRYTHGLGYGDVNGDGRADLLEKDGWWEQPASLAGDPVWAKHAYSFGAGGAQMYAYDVDGDGDNDIITTMDAHGFGLAWFEQVKQAGAITFTRHMIMGNRQEVATYGLAFSQLHALALTDIDGDGLKDLVTGKRKWAHGPSGDVEPNAPSVLYAFQLQRAAGKVQFLPRLIDSTAGIGTRIGVEDMNGDGAKDLLIGNKNGTFLFLKVGNPSDIRRSPGAKIGMVRLKGPYPEVDMLGRTVAARWAIWGTGRARMHFTLARPGENE